MASSHSGVCKDEIQLQLTLYLSLRKALYHVDLETILRKRFQRWARTQIARVPWAVLARRAVERIAYLKGIVPPCSLAALFRSWLNGWCTSRRFQEKGKCWLDCRCNGDDSLEHYAHCNVSWAWVGKHARTDTRQRGLARFLVLDVLPNDCTVVLTTNVYAVYSAVNHFRARQQRGNFVEAFNVIQERWRFAETLAPRVTAALAKRWNTRSC